MDSRIAPEHIIERDGKAFVLYAGLLAAAHADGLVSIETTVVQIPSEDNGMMAVVAAKVTTSKGTFSEVGDASPANVGRFIIPHILRMASTRAKARALRDAINVGVTAFEELGPDPGEEPAYMVETDRNTQVIFNSAPVGPGTNMRQRAQQAIQQRSGPLQAQNTGAGAGDASEAQRRAIYAIAKGIGWSGEMVDTYIDETYQQSGTSLTKRQASEVIDYLKTQTR